MPMNPSTYRPASSPGLSRYGSAPGSLLASIAGSIVGGEDGELSAAGSDRVMSRFFTGDYPCLASESSYRATISPDLDAHRSSQGIGAGAGLQRSDGLNVIPAAGVLTADGGLKGGGASLVRHSSSPAGFLSHLMVDQGSRLKSQWSFSRQDSLSQISEISISDIGESIASGNNSDEAAGNVGHSYVSSDLPIGSWDDMTMFSAPPSKLTKDNTEDFVTNLSNLGSRFGTRKTLIEMASAEKFLRIQQDSTPCKIRAKRGCATHPRSIAERERRTRIGKKLRKLQDLVPNMDKQTSTSDMLVLAVEYIKELQVQVQNLNQEQANCTCTGKQEMV